MFHRFRSTLSALLTMALGIVLGLAAPAASVVSFVATPQRAMWVWNRADPAAVISWAGRRGVREIFAYVTPDLAASGDLPRLRDLKRRADAAGIRLAALGGEPGWTFDHASALAWQRTALGTGLFARSHLDVEPYALDAWSNDQPATVQAFLDLLTALRADDPRPLEADVPFWYGGIPAGTGNLADALLRRVDAVTVMTYRDTVTGPNSIMAVGADMLARGDAAGIPVRLAVETMSLPDCPHCTFYEEGRRRLTAALVAVDTAAAGQPAFAGVAVHHYGAWIAL